MDLKPISAEDFNDVMLRKSSNLNATEFYNYFEPYIKLAENFAVAPYFWLIPNQTTMTVADASANISKLTPYTQEEWIGQSSFFG